MKKSFPLIPMLLVLLLAFFSLACADQEASDSDYSSTDSEEQTTSATQDDNADSAHADAGVLPPSNQFNSNTAVDEDFDQIPGITDHMKYEFDEYRPYSSIAQFRKEMSKYIDDEQIAAYEQYLYVPVDFNTSDAISLQQIPGVNETIASAIIAGRPYDSAQAFMDTAKNLLPTFDAEKAAAFLVK